GNDWDAVFYLFGEKTEKGGGIMNNPARKTKRRRGQSAVVLCALFACLFVLIVLNLAIGDENIGLWDVLKSLAGQGDAGVRFL
ncbi:hypothetical protein PFZ55_57625, partial [Streptomyces sp. MS2A]|nr:hypothetical protein [Streptomyces sp. MS2A]